MESSFKIEISPWRKRPDSGERIENWRSVDFAVPLLKSRDCFLSLAQMSRKLSRYYVWSVDASSAHAYYGLPSLPPSFSGIGSAYPPFSDTSGFRG